MLKAIQTKYRGRVYRSRLEARWAAYFDALRIEFEYEVEGFDLPSGWYLPDFFFPQGPAWMEIKPPYCPEDGVKKCRELALATGHRVFLSSGSPDKKASVCIPDRPEVFERASFEYLASVDWFIGSKSRFRPLTLFYSPDGRQGLVEDVLALKFDGERA